MKSIRRALLVSLVPAAVLAFAAAPSQGQQMILETEPGSTTAAFCDSAHNVKTCASVHIETQAAVRVGAVVQLDGEDWIVDWMGPGYYLSNGLVIEPSGKLYSDLKGQRWIEVYPDEGKIHTSRGWDDRDRNKALSTTDFLALDDGPEVKVQDVRLHLRVSPAQKGKKPAQEREED